MFTEQWPKRAALAFILATGCTAQDVTYSVGGQTVTLHQSKEFTAYQIYAGANSTVKLSALPSVNITTPGAETSGLLVTPKRSLAAAAAVETKTLIQNELRELPVYKTVLADTYAIMYPEILIQFKPGSPVDTVRKFLRLYGLADVQTTSIPDLYVAVVPNVKSLLSLVAGIAKYIPGVQFAQPNFYTVHRASINVGNVSAATAHPSAKISELDDPYAPLEWGLGDPDLADSPKIGVRKAWLKINSRGSGDVKVAIVDDGIRTNHPDLMPNIAGSADIVGKIDMANLPVKAAHGTQSAGVVAAVANTIGVVGIAPGVKLLAVRTTDVNDDGSWTASDLQIAEGIARAASMGAAVISASFSLGACPSILQPRGYRRNRTGT